MVEFIEAVNEEHKTSMDFALGRERFQKLLWVNDRISQPVEEVLELALRDLEANAKALREVTERIRPGAAVSTILEEIQQDHPTAKLLIDDAAEGLHDLEGWLRERELVRIPPGTRVRVVPTPSHMRATTTAAMSSPGPFEKEGVEGLYYVTPAAQGGAAKGTEKCLGNLNPVTSTRMGIPEDGRGHYPDPFSQKQRAPT